MSRSIRDYLEDILEAINATEDFIKELDYDSFAQDRKTIFAVSRAIEIIGEASKQIPSQITAQYPNVPWREIAKMRDKMIHHYFGINLKILWNTANNDLPRPSG
ncbi:MAG TPA: DUF86 domain-containing protein [Xenococcaceae cyanobacterium]